MYLGIDLGTSAIKAILLDDADVVRDEARVSLSLSRPHPLWSEQDPSEWWAATNEAVSRLDRDLRRQVRAVGLSGQMHGAVLLDRDRRIIRPAILWNDGRSEAECAEIAAREPRIYQITANLLMPGFTASKPVWVRKYEPENFDRIDLILLPKDYLRLRMTGEAATDMSDASGTSWVDVGKRVWSDEMLIACDLSRSQMPRLCEGTEVTGTLRAELAEAWGMSRVPVAAGGGDNAAGAAGVGVIHDGEALLSLGTSGVLFAATSELRPNVEGTVHAFGHCLPNLWHQMSVMLNAASCLDWVVNLTGQAGVGDMLAELEARGITDTSEFFLPYLTGERTPHNNPYAKGAFFGLGAATDRLSLSLSVLEGVAMAMADGLDVLTDAGTELERITVIGGGARSNFWGGILSAALNRPLVYREGSEVGPSLGAARLARLCLGEDSPEDVCKAPRIISVVEPERHMVERLQPKRETFRALYQNTKSLLARETQ